MTTLISCHSCDSLALFPRPPERVRNFGALWRRGPRVDIGWSAPSGRGALWHANLGRRSFVALPQATMGLGLRPAGPPTGTCHTLLQVGECGGKIPPPLPGRERRGVWIRWFSLADCQRPPALLARRHRPPPAPQPPPRPFGLPTAGDLAPLDSLHHRLISIVPSGHPSRHSCARRPQCIAGSSSEAVKVSQGKSRCRLSERRDADGTARENVKSDKTNPFRRVRIGAKSGCFRELSYRGTPTKSGHSA